MVIAINISRFMTAGVTTKTGRQLIIEDTIGTGEYFENRIYDPIHSVRAVLLQEGWFQPRSWTM